MEFTAEQINNAFASLSQETNQAMFRVDTDARLADIVKKYNLHIDTANTLGLYVTYTLIGLIKNETLASAIIKDLNLPSDIAQKIIEDINETIFKAIREKMQDFEESEKRLKEMEQENKEMDVPVPPYNKPVVEKTPPPNLPIMPVSPSQGGPTSAQIGPVQDSEKELGVMKSAGIELIPEEPVPNSPFGKKEEENKMTMKEDTLLVKSGIDLIPSSDTFGIIKAGREEKLALPTKEEEKSTLYGIEHPQNIEGDIIRNKLKGAVLNTATVSDHGLSVNKNPIPQSPALNNDKYHESV